MKRALIGVALLAMALMAAFAFAQDKEKTNPPEMKKMTHVAAPNTPEWRQLSSLVGQWQGTVVEGGKKNDISLEVRMTGDGSALMHLLDKDTPHEMVTMFHPDGDTLMATHYCSAHNQPRFRMAAAAEKNQLAFRFKDGTNIGPGDGHMVGLVITFLDANHHDEAWSYEEQGKEMPATVFHFTRKQ
jgi:hypothetical protein